MEGTSSLPLSSQRVPYHRQIKIMFFLSLFTLINVTIFGFGYLEGVTVLHPRFLGVIKTMRQPLLLQQLESVFAQIKRLSPPKIKQSMLKNLKTLLKTESTNFKSLSSSSKSSKYKEPQRHARCPLITIMYVEVITRKTPVPAPHSCACATASHTFCCLQQFCFKHTIVPHSRQMLVSWATEWHWLQGRSW